MTSLISTRFPSTRRRNARRLGFDPLESRALLTAGVLDPSFGTAGIVTSPELEGNNVAPYAATALYPQTDAGDPTDAGKIVVAGTYNTGTKDVFAVLRYKPNGSLDTSFGGTGLVTTSLTSLTPTTFASVASSSPDGKIPVAGSKPMTSWLPRRLHLRPRPGSLQHEWDARHVLRDWRPGRYRIQVVQGPADVSVHLDPRPGAEWRDPGRGLWVRRDRRKWHLGRHPGASQGERPEWYLLRQHQRRGVHRHGVSDGSGVVRDVGLQTVNGTTKIVAVGGSSANSASYAIRYSLNGSLDTSFGTKGIATGPSMTVTSGAIQPDGSIIAAGSVAGSVTINGNLYGTSHMSLVRFTPTGSLDTSFGTGGEVQTAFVSGRDSSAANSVVVQPDGAIVAGGYAPSYAGSPGAWAPLEPALARYTPTGQLDTTFGAAGTGLVVTPVDSTSPDNGRITGLALQADGGIVTTGYAQFGSSYDFLTARYLGDPAMPFPSAQARLRRPAARTFPNRSSPSRPFRRS